MKKKSFLILLYFVIGFSSCSNDKSNDLNNDTTLIKVAFHSMIADGSVTVTTTKLTLTFDKDIEGLIADDITLTAGNTGAVKGMLTAKGSGVYELAVSNISVSGNLAVAVSKTRHEITPASKNVMVYYVNPVKQVAFSGLAANGSVTETSTMLTLTFDKDIEGLIADDITLTAGNTGAVKGILKAKGSGVYEFAVSDISTGGELTVAVSKAGYEITPASKTVMVHYIDPVEQVTFLSLTANGSVTETTMKLILTLDKYVNLAFNEIVLTGNTGAVLKEFSFQDESGKVLELSVRGIKASGDVTVTINKMGYEIIPVSKTVKVYYKNIIGDFYYSDGTHSTQKDAAKDCIGIVFWQDPDNSTKGKIVSLDEGNGGPEELARWASSKKGGWRLPTIDELQYLWCTYNGTEFVTWEAGRDVPRPAVNAAAQAAFNNQLTSGGGVVISNTYHWSSTKTGISNSFFMDFKDGYFATTSDNSRFEGRAVSAF